MRLEDLIKKDCCHKNNIDAGIWVGIYSSASYVWCSHRWRHSEIFNCMNIFPRGRTVGRGTVWVCSGNVSACLCTNGKIGTFLCWRFSHKHIHHIEIICEILAVNQNFLPISQTLCPGRFLRKTFRSFDFAGSELGIQLFNISYKFWQVTTSVDTIIIRNLASPRYAEIVLRRYGVLR